MSLRFRDLAPGEVFEFDHSDMKEVSCIQIAHGPWRKTQRLYYVQVDNPRYEIRVGLTTAKVRKGTSCK